LGAGCSGQLGIGISERALEDVPTCPSQILTLIPRHSSINSGEFWCAKIRNELKESDRWRAPRDARYTSQYLANAFRAKPGTTLTCWAVRKYRVHRWAGLTEDIDLVLPTREASVVSAK
jgi:hypothetical protein